MSLRSPRLAIPALLLLPLAACGPARNEFAPVCPNARLVPQLADAVSFANPGPKHDVTDLIYQARITSVQGKCKPGDSDSQLSASATVTISATRGPAMKGREFDIPMFLAVTEGDTILDKKVYPVHLIFPSNVDQLTVTSPEIDMTLPISSQKSGLAYDIIAGFQLTPDQTAGH